MSSCTVCKKGPPQVTLKNCAKCSTTPYCSRDCQKADWKSHKKTCGLTDASAQPRAGNTTSTGTALSPPKGLDQPITRPFTKLDNGTWLHDRPEADVYRLLIDAYRLHVEDEYNIDGEAAEDSIYGGAEDGLEGFRGFVKKAAKRKGLLPAWWSSEKQAACERLGGAEGDDDDDYYDLGSAVEKADIIERYGDPRFPMQLRMFAEAVNLRGPGGQDGTPMRKMMASMEGGAYGSDFRS
ncbi:putative MYND domain protein [Colletotrichum phormii]|uniref:MYND domain protein n=1 Tax=Colletotrichum phormii TaxID=359342 RepID=A0AAI9ZSU6_9PEZI|nr:putative MYND domain protein [Colletotrichum phormii]KAK1637185.1 putative MYND domain protein [Colletotrichum phormii]